MKLHLGDCLEILKTIPDNSIDSLITDPPAGIFFMGKEWDSAKGGRKEWIEWMSGVMRECLRVLKPGAHGLVWSLPRTSHWTATALEEAGFEVRDQICHLFGSGFPKSLNISKAIDKAAGAERQILGTYRNKLISSNNGYAQDEWSRTHSKMQDVAITAPATDAAKQWDGWGTALKPAQEIWWLVRKPLSEKTVADNVLKWGTGGINVDGCRIEFKSKNDEEEAKNKNKHSEFKNAARGKTNVFAEYKTPRETWDVQGRWPANLVFSHCETCTDEKCDIECAVKMLDEQSGPCPGPWGKNGDGNKRGKTSLFQMGGVNSQNKLRGQEKASGASRFFYCAKVSPSERNAGLDRYELISISCPEWESVGQKVQLQVDTEQYPPKVIDASGTSHKNASEWNTLLFGSATTDQLQESCKFTTKMGTSSIIESKTLSWLALSNTNASILDANCEKAFGGNHAQLVQPQNQSQNSTSAKMVIVINANDAQLPARLLIKSVGPLKSSHPTVKAQKLMRYLCRLITPPKGVVLDPFMGSGSTGLAAIAEGFEFIGIEKESEYFEIAQARIKSQWFKD